MLRFTMSMARVSVTTCVTMFLKMKNALNYVKVLLFVVAVVGIDYNYLYVCMVGEIAASGTARYPTSLVVDLLENTADTATERRRSTLPGAHFSRLQSARQETLRLHHRATTVTPSIFHTHTH